MSSIIKVYRVIDNFYVKIFFVVWILPLLQLNCAKIKFDSPGSALIVNSGANFLASTVFSNVGGTFVQKTGSVVSGVNSGTNIIFTDGYFDNNGIARLTTNYNIFSGNNIAMTGSQVIKSDGSGMTVAGLTVSGTGNKILGTPTFTGTPTLASGAELQLGIENDMTVNLALASGTLTLLNDLSWADTFKPTGTGNINLNSGYKFILGSQPLSFSSAITWQNTGELVLHSKTTLTATWSVSNNMTINGSGNVLDITGGVLAIASGATLNLSNVYLKGWGGSNITFAATSSNLRLSNVVIDLTASVTLTTGNVYVDGPVTIITQNNVLTFSSNAVLTVDGNTLWYDTQTFSASNNIVPTTAGANLVLTNGGTIKALGATDLSSINSILATIDHGPSNVTLSGSTTLSYDYNLSDDHTMTISATGTINGNGHRIRFSNNKTAQLIINTGVTATFTNCIFENFADEHLSLVGTGAIVFGSGCRIDAMNNDTWTKVYSFGANTVLNGNMGAITLGAGSAIVSTDTGGTGLRILDLTIQGVSTNNIRCSSNSAKLILDNSTFVMTTNWTWATGILNIARRNAIFGPYIFAYQSTATSVINTASELAFQAGTTLQYAPTVSTANLITMVDATSRLKFIDAALSVSTVGMQLTIGTLAVDGQLNISSSATSIAQAVRFGGNSYTTDLNIEIAPGASINLLTGYLLYDNKEVSRNLAYGDQVVLQNKKYGWYLVSALTDRYTHFNPPSDGGPPAVILGGVFVDDVRNKWLMGAFFVGGGEGIGNNYASTQKGVGSICYGGAYSCPSDISVLVNINNAAGAASMPALTLDPYMWCNTTTAPPPVSSPYPPYFGIRGSNNYSNSSGIAFIKKVNGYTSDAAFQATHPVTMRQGDTIYVVCRWVGGFGGTLFTSYPSLLYGTANNFTVNSVTYQEACAYDASVTALPTDGGEEWIIAQIIAGS